MQSLTTSSNGVNKEQGKLCEGLFGLFCNNAVWMQNESKGIMQIDL